MSDASKKVVNRQARLRRIRTRIHGTSARPRLSVFVSNRHISAQLIDDDKQHTLFSVTTVGQTKLTGTKSDYASWVGGEIAKKAKSAKVKTVVLDRGSKLYHGRMKALADAARKEGLEF